MAARIIQGIPKSVDFCKLKFIDIVKQRRPALCLRSPPVGFRTSAAMISDGASAQGPHMKL